MIVVALIFGIAAVGIFGDVECTGNPNIQTGTYEVDPNWNGECQVSAGPITLTPIGSNNYIKIGD